MLELNPVFQKFLDQHFSFVETKFDGRVHIFSSNDLTLRIVEDRNSKLFMHVSIKEVPETSEDWIIVSDLKSLMLNNDDY